MDQGLIGLVVAAIGGVLMLVGVLVLANTEKTRINKTGEVAEAEGPGLYLIYAGLAGIGAGLIIILVQ
ncbi:MAG: hypothetical protein KAQ96_00140 [Thermoplasmata archaeon]|nr:hypothetical protein [Thermoplasmata archaeon]